METSGVYEGESGFEDIRAILRDTAKRQEETARRQEEIARRQEETDRLVRENSRQIGKLGNRFGEMIEYMVKPNLVGKFRELGFVFTKAASETDIKDEKNNIVAEVDITLENGEKVMIVEVKSKPVIEDVKEHIERMEKVRRYASLRGDRRKYLGAVAGMVIKANTQKFALEQGFYVVEPSGETFIITAPKGSPREW
ncbi:MAG: hypothetical protein LBC67_03070 [Spirochaetales bacterium]|nr:hypothetical protein [Spirochaetales bacterium]